MGLKFIQEMRPATGAEPRSPSRRQATHSVGSRSMCCSSGPGLRWNGSPGTMGREVGPSEAGQGQ